MADLTSITTRWTPRLLSMVRIVASFLFMAHGSQKLYLFPPSQLTEPFSPFSFVGFGGVLELFGGLLLLIGYRTRLVAFLLSGEMAVAYFRSHAPQDFWPIINHGELAILYCFVFLYFAAAGGGPWSMDHIVTRKKSS